MPKTLKENYNKNVLILRENLKRGLAPHTAIQIITGWRESFIRNNLYGQDEKDFINAAMAEVEPYTNIEVVEQ